jgi:hypothetical protein
MKLSVGRVVWYYPPAHGDSQPWPALICFVSSDTLVNIGGFRSDGTPFDACNVQLFLPEAAPQEGPHCTWMPYQVSADQQAKQAQAGVSAPSSLKPLK